MAKKKINPSLYTESIKEFIKNNPDKAAEYLAEEIKTYYGFNIQEPDAEDKKEKLKSFAPPVDLEGALITGYSAFNPQYVDFGAQRTNDEIRLIDRYREMALSPECESAIEDIINEFISIDEETNPINIVLDEVTSIDDSVKDQIRDEFEYILNIFEFKQYGYDLIRKWYTDGRLYYHLIIDTTNEESVREGIQEVRYIDPRKIKKVKERPKSEIDKMKGSSVSLHAQYDEYFLYSEMGFDIAASTMTGSSNPMNGLKIAKDSIAYAHSGVIDYKTGIVLSHLHKAIKPYNQLRMMEDATVIYRISRAPERRIFYIDIEGLTPQVAERYINNVADRFKNKLSYDVSTGEITNDRRYMTMLEDFFLGQRDGKGTNVSNLPGGQNLGEMEDVEYFRRKLYKALNVPITRLEAENAFNLGRPQEITRDEVKFSKFIKRMRAKFVSIFEQALERHLILKGIITPSEWEDIRQFIFYDFKEDNHFTELREAEILTNRLGLLSQVHSYTTDEGGGYFSKAWVKKHVLRQDEKEVKEIQKQIADEREESLEKGIDPNASTGIGGFGMGGMGMGGGMEDPTMGGMTGTGMPEPEMQGQFNQGAMEGPPPASADMGNSNSTSMSPNKKKR